MIAFCGRRNFFEELTIHFQDGCCPFNQQKFIHSWWKAGNHNTKSWFIAKRMLSKKLTTGKKSFGDETLVMEDVNTWLLVSPSNERCCSYVQDGIWKLRYHELYYPREMTPTQHFHFCKITTLQYKLLSFRRHSLHNWIRQFYFYCHKHLVGQVHENFTWNGWKHLVKNAVRIIR